MTRYVLLNNIDHRDLRVDPRRGEAFGDGAMFALAVPSEFRNLQAHYPIVFQRAQDGGCRPVALLGLRQGENLFLAGDRWDAHYIPLAMDRLPFAIGAEGGQPMVHIDLDHPRVLSGQGEALFREHGGTTGYLERVNSVLRALHDGLGVVPSFVALLDELQLLEPFVLDIELDDGTRHSLSGFQTIQEERLGMLDGASLQRLMQAGFLEPIYMAMASLSNFRALIERMNRAHASHG